MIPKAEIPRSSFRMEKMVKTAMGFSYLVPIMVEEVLPGDTWKAHITTVARTAVPIVPPWTTGTWNTFAFFVPNRLLWTNWVKFMGEQDNPGDSISYTIPVCNPTTGYAVSSLQDYMGLITTGQNNGNPWSHSALPLRAYNQIYNAWFRDENLQNSVAKMSETDQTAPATTCSSNEESEKTTSRAPYRGRRKETQLSLFPSELLHQSMSQPQSLPGIACDSTSWVQRQLDKSSARIQERAQPGEHSAQQVKRWKSLQISLPLPQQRSINSDRVSRYNAYLKEMHGRNQVHRNHPKPLRSDKPRRKTPTPGIHRRRQNADHHQCSPTNQFNGPHRCYYAYGNACGNRTRARRNRLHLQQHRTRIHPRPRVSPSRPHLSARLAQTVEPIHEI